MKIHRLLLAFFCMGSIAFADNAVPIATRNFGEKTLTIFAHPAPLRAGPVELAILLTDQKTGAPETAWEADGSLLPPSPTEGRQAESWVAPCCQMGTSTTADGSVSVLFSGSASGNEWMRGARVVLAESGIWNLRIHLKTEGKQTDATFPIHVGTPPAPLTRYWFLFLSLPVATLVYLGSRGPAQAHKPG